MEAVRELLAGGAASTILGNAGLEVVVGAGWLTLSLLTFHRLAEAGRRDRSIVFSSA